MGQRLADDHLARTRGAACPDLRSALDAVARGALRTYLGASASVVASSTTGAAATASDAGGGGAADALSVVIEDCPLADWVDLPPALAALSYQALLAGAVRGGLDAVGIPVDAAVVRCAARGDGVTEIRVTPRGAPPAEAYPFKDDD